MVTFDQADIDDSYLDEIREDTCIITHGGVIAAVMEHLFPEEKENRYQWQPKPGHGYAVNGLTFEEILVLPAHRVRII